MPADPASRVIRTPSEYRAALDRANALRDACLPPGTIMNSPNAMARSRQRRFSDLGVIRR
jgi:hypothetical protein